MSPEEEQLFNSIVDRLRTKGWSRIDAEGEALDRIYAARENAAATAALETEAA